MEQQEEAMTDSMHQQPASTQRGFTLLEVLLAVSIAAVTMTAVAGAFMSTMQARNVVDSLTQSTEDGERILSLMEHDLRGLWCYNIKDNKVFFGRNRDIAGWSADQIDFVTSTEAFLAVETNDSRWVRTPLCEVGYWLRDNRKLPGKLELWRREDPLVDNDLTSGGTFQLVCDRIESFNIEYFESIGYDAEPRDDWDSSVDDNLPRRMKIEFTIERKTGNANQVSGAEILDVGRVSKTYTRHIVFDERLPEILQPRMGMVPVAPSGPESAGASGGGAGDEEIPQGGGGAFGDLAAGAGATGSLQGSVQGSATTQTQGRGPIRGNTRGPTTTVGGGAPTGRAPSPTDLGSLLRGLGGGSTGGSGGLPPIFGGR